MGRGSPRRIENGEARRLFLDRHGLLAPPHHQDLDALIAALGFVQVDSVNTLARAHDLILWSRRQAYRSPDLPRLLKRRRLFEHWTHDAAVIPMDFFPYWRLKFEREEAHVSARWAKSRAGFKDRVGDVLDHIAARGPVMSADLAAGENRGSTGWWDWHPSKTALEYLWMSGQVAITRREGFRKVYDLVENVVPAEVLNQHRTNAEIIDWACAAALDRLGFATSGELAAFWAMVTPAEARAWVDVGLRSGRLEEVDVGCAGGAWRRSVAWPGTGASGETSGRVRVLSPFDPALRDRKRAERLFGFHYRIEIFVPEAKRQYGYYVFPVLEGDRLIGRIDMRRDSACLKVDGFWAEPGIAMGKGRMERLRSELERIARLGGCGTVQFASGWLRTG